MKTMKYNTSVRLLDRIREILEEEVEQIIEDRMSVEEKILSFLSKIDTIEGIIDPKFKEYLKDVYKEHFGISKQYRGVLTHEGWNKFKYGWKDGK